MNFKRSRTWAEVDLDCLIHNFNAFRQAVEKSGQGGKKAGIMAVVKANAYGHGAVTVAKTLVDAGADYLAVATLDEAIELRKADITTPILVLSSISPDRNGEVIRYGITSTIYFYEAAKMLAKAALKRGKTAKIHIKIDTGMTRVGFDWKTATENILEVAKIRGLEIEGLFTHFATADEADSDYTKMQFERYMQVAQGLKQSGLAIPIKHVCNSAAAINYPWMHLDMIRPGISLYGCYPAGEEGQEKEKIVLKPVMSFKTEVIRVREVDEGTSVSYGRIFTAKRKSCIATIPVGYADGFTRMLTGKASVLVKGCKAPVVGKICMDQCMIDVTGVPETVEIGDEVVLFGTQAGNRILADDLGNLAGTINYEILCMVSRRIPRYYLCKGKMIGSENYLLNRRLSTTNL